MVALVTQPDHTTQTGTPYKTAIDNSVNAGARIDLAFMPQAQASPNMTVRVLAGAIFYAGALTEISAQNTGTITAPVTHPRIDRVVLNPADGTISVVTGVEGASPAIPAVTADRVPICRFQLATSTTQITNSMIVDERVGRLDWTLLGKSVSYAKIQDISATARLLGRKTAGAGVTEELTLSEVLDLIGSAARGDILFRGASNWQRLAAGTSGQFLQTLGAGADPAWASGGSAEIVQLRNEQAASTEGGSTTSGSWQKLPLNTETVDTGGICSLSSSVFTLPAGTYEIFAKQAFLSTCGTAQLRLRNTSDGADLVTGMPAYASGISTNHNFGFLMGRFVLAGSKNLEMQYRVSSSVATNGLGTYGGGWGVVNVYGDVYIRKVA